MKTIMYSVSTGYFARNLLRTGVIERLLENKDLRIVIVTPGYEDEDFKREFSYNSRIFLEKMYEIPKVFDFMDKLIWKTWQLGHSINFFQWIYKFFLNIQLERKYRLKFKDYYESIFDKYNPDLVVGASPGVNMHSMGDLPVFATAKKRKVKTLALIHSWDNIAKRKGPMWIRPEILGVWNEFQKKEAMEANFYKAESVKLVGPPHFDIYWKNNTFTDRELFFKKMKLDPGKKLISVIATADNLVDNSYIIDILLDAFKKNLFVLPVQLLFRAIHTNRLCDENEKKFGRFYDNPDIAIDHPTGYSAKLGWNPGREQLHHFANLVKHSDVQVSIISTATIEAAILDKPAVNVGFSTLEPESFQKNIIESVYNNHFKPVLDCGATYIARNPEDLIAGINKYLLDPALHRQERKKLKEMMIYKADGKAVERISQLILSLTV